MKVPAPHRPIPPRTLRIGDADIPFALIRSPKRRRTIAFAIEGREGLVVRAPMKASYKSIEEVAQKFSRWILRRLSELREVAPSRPMESGGRLLVLGQEVRLRVMTGAGRRGACALIEDVLEVRVPEHVPSDDYGKAIEDAVLRWYREFAAGEFSRRAAHWAHELGVAFGKLVVSNPKARWGSCDAADNLRINWRVVMAPSPLVDYVLAHELCHVVHKNHSRRFWNKLAGVMPDWRVRREELRRLGPGLSI